MTLPLLGPHQIDNLSVTLSIIEALREQGYEITDSDIISGVEVTRIPARVEVLSKSPLIILDGGHNEDGAHALRKTLLSYVNDKEKTLVIGVMEDKDVSSVVEHLAPLAKRIVTTTPSNDRAMKAEALAEKAKAFCSDVTPCDDPCKAFDLARSLTSPSEALIVCGSLYLAGDVRLHMIETIG